MQSIDNYIYQNQIDVQLNLDPTIKLRNRVLYQRSIKLYKGIDNQIQFNIKNADQQPVNITGFDISFSMLSDQEGTIIASSPATVINANAGVVTVSLTERDLLDCNQEFYFYSLLATEQVSGIQHIVYSDNDYNARGQIILQSGHYPNFHPSVHVQLPTNTANVTISSAVSSDTPTRQQSAHHTAQYYFNDFSGNVIVQATLDILPPNGNTSANTSVSWATITSNQYIHQTTPDYVNWDGVYTACRFVIAPNSSLSGNVSQILYRA
jgi:hypothetical protein